MLTPSLRSSAPEVSFDGNSLRIEDVHHVARRRPRVRIDERALARASACRARLEEMVAAETPIYGITTGYGEMVYVFVGREHETTLQTNLVLSHAAGVGEPFGENEARAILCARINALAKGHSAVRPIVLERLSAYLNRGIVPVIPRVGSLGASGDLAPLSHVAATLIGEGEVTYQGSRRATASVLNEVGLVPLELKFKEGLALINGTSAMTGVGALVLHDGDAQIHQAEIIAALVLETQQASMSPFLAEGHDIARPHRGQVRVAHNLRSLLAGSQRMVSHGALRAEMSAARGADATKSTSVYLQKAYTLRCIPQILGAVRDSLDHARRVVEIELNSANDNPLFFEGVDEVFHGGNFHGQPIAIAMDLVAISLTQLGVLSERRTNRMLNRHLSNGLPEFLVAGTPGLSCGFAGAQYPATALVAENRTICSPASIQSVPSNGDNQDVVSMGLIATRNAARILDNNQYILAVEALAAAQSVDLLACKDALSPAARAAYELVREHVAPLTNDRFMARDLEMMAHVLRQGLLADRIAACGVELV